VFSGAGQRRHHRHARGEVDPHDDSFLSLPYCFVKKQRIVIISASSDFGLALSAHWLASGHEVVGTYRTFSSNLKNLQDRGLRLVRCDLSDARSIDDAAAQTGGSWDALVMCPGAQEPVGEFANCSFAEWEQSIQVNFVGQMKLTHALLPQRNRSTSPGPLVLYFAGGGTNNATVNYSAYTVSKIALIKMCELLDAEIPDTRFCILGPGWVKTKIHEATLHAGAAKAGNNFQRTVEKLSGDECNPMEKVIACCDWVLTAPRSVIGGRNLSVVFDAWGNPRLNEALIADHNLYKLRRSGNDLSFKS
jgi:NAD(P)-dependent dehydrogenase (short-subunit alcohol dehydrogenase family)